MLNSARSQHRLYNTWKVRSNARLQQIMSPKAPSARLLAYLRSSIFQRPFVCSSCLPRRSGADSLLQCRLASSRSHPSKRGFSQIAPVTAVNAQKSIPTQYQELYGAIKGLEEAAPVYVNLSQLQLALRGLESTESIVRVAGRSFIFVELRAAAKSFSSSRNRRWTQRYTTRSSSPGRSAERRGRMGKDYENKSRWKGAAHTVAFTSYAKWAQADEEQLWRVFLFREHTPTAPNTHDPRDPSRAA